MEVSSQLHARAALHRGFKGPTRGYGDEQHLLILPATEPHVFQPIAYNCPEHACLGKQIFAYCESHEIQNLWAEFCSTYCIQLPQSFKPLIPVFVKIINY